MDKITKLQNIGCTDIEPYTLVSNYGFKFTKNRVEYDLRNWENCYGVYGGGWSVNSITRPVSCPSFGENFDGIVGWIERNL